MKVITQNSTYELNTEEKLIRRLPDYQSAVLRKDTEWVKYFTIHIEENSPMRIVMEHLDGDKETLTIRNTSPVVRIED